MNNQKTKSLAPKQISKYGKSRDCPECKATLTETEREYYPCNCFYQGCFGCLTDIIENRGICPNCKSNLRIEKSVVMEAIKKEEPKKTEPEKLKPKKAEKKTVTQTIVTTVSSKHSTTSTVVGKSNQEDILRSALKKYGFTELSKLRVIQKNLVYVIGLSPQIANSEMLEKMEFFGQYGKITKTVVNKNHAYNPGAPNGPSYSAYLTYSNDIEASIAILAVDQVSLYERLIRASYGTTKYCTFFLKEQTCPNPDCLYLHAMNKDQDSFVKDDALSNKNIFSGQQKIAFEHINKHLPDVFKKISAVCLANKKLRSILPPTSSIHTKIKKYFEHKDDNYDDYYDDEDEYDDEEEIYDRSIELHQKIKDPNKILGIHKEGHTEKNISISPLKEKEKTQEKIEIKNDLKSETQTHSHRSSISNISTNENSSYKKDNVTDMKEDFDTKLSPKSEDELIKAKSIKQDSHTVNIELNNESKINTATIINEKLITHQEIEDIIADKLLNAKTGYNSSRFPFTQENNEIINSTPLEEFNIITQTIKDYMNFFDNPIKSADPNTESGQKNTSQYNSASKPIEDQTPSINKTESIKHNQDKIASDIQNQTIQNKSAYNTTLTPSGSKTNRKNKANTASKNTDQYI